MRVCMWGGRGKNKLAAAAADHPRQHQKRTATEPSHLSTPLVLIFVCLRRMDPSVVLCCVVFREDQHWMARSVSGSASLQHPIAIKVFPINVFPFLLLLHMCRSNYLEPQH